MGIFHRHFIFVMSVSALLIFSSLVESAQREDSKRSLSVFPILMYDSDIGFGFGAKAKFVDYLVWFDHRGTVV